MDFKKQASVEIVRDIGIDFDLDKDYIDERYGGSDFVGWPNKKLTLEGINDPTIIGLGGRPERLRFVKPVFTALSGFTGAPDQELETRFSPINRGSSILTAQKSSRKIILEFTLQELPGGNPNKLGGLGEAINTLQNTLSLVDEPYPIFFRFKGAVTPEVFKVFGVISDFDIVTDSMRANKAATGSLEITALDSRVYVNEVEVHRLFPGWGRAMSFPIFFPFSFTHEPPPQSNKLEIHIHHREPIPLTILLRGALQKGTKLINKTSGEHLELAKDLGFGETLVVSGNTKRILLKSGNMQHDPSESYITLTSEFLSVAPMGMQRRLNDLDSVYMNDFELESENDSGYVELWLRKYL